MPQVCATRGDPLQGDAESGDVSVRHAELADPDVAGVPSGSFIGGVASDASQTFNLTAAPPSDSCSVLLPKYVDPPSIPAQIAQLPLAGFKPNPRVRACPVLGCADGAAGGSDNIHYRLRRGEGAGRGAVDDV